MGIRNSRIASLARSRPRSGLALLLFSILALIIWNPRFYHTLSGRDIIPLIPKPVVSTRLEGRFLDLDTRLKEHFSKHKQVLPEKVFPYHALTKAQQKRYSGLRDAEGTYMFSTITRQIQDQLPDLLSALLVVVDTLGSAKVSFSFLEGPSSDVTPSVFRDVLHPFLISLNVPESRIKIVTDSPKIDFNAGNRIELLANLRNKAIEPLWDDRGVGGVGHDVKALIMFNDVYLRAEHILEVMYKHHVKGAGISTAWDWWKRDPAYYYDVWVGRTIDTGDLFYPMPNTHWSPSSDLFPTSPSSLDRFNTLDAFPVYSSWNGLAVLDPKPIVDKGVRFRRGDAAKDECTASECTLICGDYWKAGYGRVQVVPSVQLAYERDVAVQTEKMIQEQRLALGWHNGVPPKQPRKSNKVFWSHPPPKQVRCQPWPEINGLQANVWERTRWVSPWLED